jgi:hypothetical protein
MSFEARPISEEDNARQTRLPPLQPAPIRKSQLLRDLSIVKDPPVDSIQDISDYVLLYKSKHDKELVLNRHERAEDVQHMMDTFSENARHSIFRRRCHTSLSDLHGRLSTAGWDRATLQDDTTLALSNFEGEAADRLETLEARFAAQWEEHLANRPDETPAKFRRRSPQLLEMCRQERRLFFQSRFDEAAVIRQECEIREAAEARAMNRQALDHWQNVGEHLQEKHRRARESMLYWIETRREEITKNGTAQEEALQRRQALLGNQIAGTKSMLRRSMPRTVMRKLLFDKTTPMGTIIPVRMPVNITKLSHDLPPRAKEILLHAPH